MKTLIALLFAASVMAGNPPPYYYYMPPTPLYNRPQSPDVMYPAPNGTWVNNQQRHGGTSAGFGSGEFIFSHYKWNNMSYTPRQGDFFIVNGQRLPMVKSIDISLSPFLYINHISYEHLTAKKRTHITNVTSVTLPVKCQKELLETAVLYRQKMDKELQRHMTIITRPGQEPVTNINPRVAQSLGR